MIRVKSHVQRGANGGSCCRHGLNREGVERTVKIPLSIETGLEVIAVTCGLLAYTTRWLILYNYFWDSINLINLRPKWYPFDPPNPSARPPEAYLQHLGNFQSP